MCILTRDNVHKKAAQLSPLYLLPHASLYGSCEGQEVNGLPGERSVHILNVSSTLTCFGEKRAEEKRRHACLA